MRFAAQSQPFWLTLSSKAAEMNSNMITRAAGATYEERDDVLAVELPESGDCVELAIYDVTGHAVLEEKRCKPEACVVLESWPGGCDGPVTSGFDPTKVGITSCDDPPLLEYESGVGFEYPTKTQANPARSCTAKTCATRPLQRIMRHA